MTRTCPAALLEYLGSNGVVVSLRATDGWEAGISFLPML